MRRAVCPGSFARSPSAIVVARASALSDEVVVAVGVNRQDGCSAPRRLDMLRRTTTASPNVTVAGFSGLLTDFCRAEGVTAIVKGLRAVGGFDYELQMAQMNAHLAPGVEGRVRAYPCSARSCPPRAVKEVAAYGGDVSAHLPGFVHARLLARLAERA
ncbi:MAG: pantetheine-phosphate adenylyltransferase [Nocardioides sp.]